MSSRRQLLKGLAATPLAAVLADPRLARAAAQTTRQLSVALPDGGAVAGALAEPEGAVKGGVVLIHEWWGLNDQIKSVAVALAGHGFLALAADLYGGKSTTSPDEARALTRAVDPARATQTLTAWMSWLREHERNADGVATLGWCFGGGWSLNASLAAPAEATVIYYGRVNKTAAELASLRGPVLGHFATQDRWINGDMVGAFEREMSRAGKTFTTHWYDAKHGFANPTTERYDAEDAAVAWSRTLAFLNRYLGG